MSETGAGQSAWRSARLAAEAFALAPLGGGVIVRGRPGPVRDAWLDVLRAALPPDAPMRRVPASIADDRLLGGLDVAATLKAGRPVAEAGLLAETDGGVLVIAMAERLPPGVAARIAVALDNGEITLARDGLATTAPARVGFVALDEGDDEGEATPAILFERGACFVSLDGISAREAAEAAPPADYAAARARFAALPDDPAVVEALVGAAAALGVASLRAPIYALHIARALAALDSADRVEERHVALAGALCLARRATRLPSESDEQPEQPPEPENPDPSEEGRDEQPDRLEDKVLDAAKAVIPLDLLARLKAGARARAQAAMHGKSGDRQLSTRRGRPFGYRPGKPSEGRIALVATLRAAAPWQPLRRRELAAGEKRLVVSPDDMRIVMHQQRRGATTIFVVDASGSAALHRLAEVKGAIELLLADCYVRRDSVALVAFRGVGAEIVLPPTRSTARARGRLAGLPGGGGTPLAAGIDAATGLALHVRRTGQTPFVVLMTDGNANIGRDGNPGRAKALEDAVEAGKRLFVAGVSALAIDTSPPGRQRDSASTVRVAEAMGADYLKLPVADSQRVNAAVRRSAERVR